MMKTILVLGLLIACFQTVIAQTSPHGSIKIKCDNCHGTDSWKMQSDAQFSHASTGFDLTGAHKKLECRSCHEGLKFTGVKADCQPCHTDIHKGELGQNCLRCHSTQLWKITDMIQRHQQTRFPLIGPHATAPCEACHTQNANQQYTGTPTICIGCHRKDYLNSQNPNHTRAGFSTECTQCHQVNGPAWGGGFDHQTTAFPLTGAHRAVQCAKCHTTNAFKSTPQECYMCHLSNYNAVQSPNHVIGKFPHQCLNCHNTSVWTPSTFNHANTLFPLVGAHRAAPCASCHVNNIYAGLHQNCIDCHRTDFNGAANPNHGAGNFSTTCSTCHSMNAWSPASFDHSATKFPLTGKHLTLQCQDCHTNGNYQLVYSNCYQCHQNDFNQTTNPNHAAGNFSHQCETCHSTTSWSSSTFDHSTTKFTLTGAHVATPCVSCHVSNNYRLSYTNCYMCHQADFQKPTNPNHVAGSFAQTCNQCHTTSVWTPSTFNHSNTAFPLIGAHQAVPCTGCHATNVYAGLHQNCIDCHQADFNGATNPNHVTGNFSTTCTTCHSMAAWSPASFDHSNTKFALSGAHTSVQCQACHTNGNYRLVYTNCYQCHATDFKGATTPVPHTGFPTDCSACHTSNPGWTPSTYNHANAVPRFPTDSRHRSAACTKCHQTPTNYTVFCCQSSGCHDTCAGGD
jgi:nitrate/TMAO reductase-like tetraheme cytochrome c subunit